MEQISSWDSDSAWRLRRERICTSSGKKLAQAAEAGEEVLELARNYSTLDVADFLAGVTRILEIRAKHLGATADVSVQRVKDIRQRLESDSRLSPILKLPALNMIAECKR